jgi:hypothetical protein
MVGRGRVSSAVHRLARTLPIPDLRLLAFLLLMGVMTVVLAWAWVPDSPPSTDCHLEYNAAWISVDWTSKPSDPEAVHALASSTSSRRIRYLFPYTTFLKPDGSFSASYAHAAEFVSQFRQYDRETRLLAWIGIPLKNDRPVGVRGWVDLTDGATRRGIVSFVAQLVRDAGFDGVHLDAETVPNGDADFLLLLDEVRIALGEHATISVASNHWFPGALNVLPYVRDWWWTDAYYQEVAARVDQLATMTYDSYAPVPGLYRLWMREQVRGVAQSLAHSNVDLLFGISVSREETASHQPGVETLNDGLAGICAGLMDGERGSQGAAIYADWEFSPSDSQVWNKWIR